MYNVTNGIITYIILVYIILYELQTAIRNFHLELIFRFFLVLITLSIIGVFPRAAVLQQRVYIIYKTTTTGSKMFPLLQRRLMTIVSMRVSREYSTYTRTVSALASANNFSHPENRWPVLLRIGGKRYICTRLRGMYIYMLGVFSYFVPGGNIYLLRSRI